MSEKDPFKDFITKNTSEPLKKPANEFSEILQKIENKKSFFNFPNWIISGVVTASLVLVIGFSLKENTATAPIADDEVAFLFDHFSDEMYEEEENNDLYFLETEDT